MRLFAITPRLEGAIRAAGCSLLLLAARDALAQGYPFSQRGSVEQDVAFTHITVEYGRPVARGRKLFGALVPWDSVWHPGADSATRIAFDHDVLLEGHEVKAGEYSLWLVPREHAAWTFILNRVAHTFHKPYPGAAHDALRVDVMPETVSHVETLAIYFPLVLRDEAVLRIHWGETAVDVRIKAPFRGTGEEGSGKGKLRTGAVQAAPPFTSSRFPLPSSRRSPLPSALFPLPSMLFR